MTEASPTLPPHPKMTPALALRIVTPFALGYFLSYLYRSVNAVIAPELIADLKLDASALGLLTAAFFLTFAAAQLPLGILLDRYGPERVESALLLLAAAGAALFASTPNEGGLIAGRALIGLGVSACLMAAFKAYVLWFPIERLALMNGIQLAAGGLGALTATRPVEAALAFTDWRGVFWILAAVTLLAALALFRIVPKHDGGEGRATLGEAMRGVAEVFKSPVFWRVAPWVVLSQATFMSLQTLWVGPWLTDVAGLGRTETAEFLFWIAAAMTVSFLAWGALSERLTKYFGVRPMSVAVVGMSVYMAAQVLIASELALTLDAALPGFLLATWVTFGFAGTAGVLSYAALSQAFPRHLAGRVNTGLNLPVFMFAFAGQWAAGAIIDLWPPSAAGGYAREGFQAALWALLTLQGAAAAWFWARRDTRI